MRPITRSISRFPIPRLLNLLNQMSDNGDELRPFRVRALLLEPNQANFIVTRLVTRRENSLLTI